MKIFQRSNIVLLLISSLFALVLGELILRQIQPEIFFCTLDRNLKQFRKPLFQHFPGLDSIVYRSSNDMGYRGSKEFSKDNFGILAIGASTTECAFLSDEDTWCHLLQERLNKSFKDKNIVVGNVGRSGLHSGHHLLQLKHLTPQYENIELVLLLLGINDYKRFLSSSNNYLATANESTLYRHAFYRYPIKYNAKWYQQPELWMLFRKISKNFAPWKNARNPKTSYGPLIAKNRSNFHAIIEVDTVPDLSIPLADFEENILKTIRLAKEQNFKIVFMTQPTLWHENIDSTSSLYCYPYLYRKDNETYTSRVYAKGMDLFNQKLLKLSSVHGIRCINLADAIQKDTSVFYDDCHFNKGGAIKVSEILHDSLFQLIIK